MAVLLAAGDTLDLLFVGAERERIEDMAANAAMIVAERRYRFDSAGELTCRAAPYQRHAVTELGESHLQRLKRDRAVAMIEAGFQGVQALRLRPRGHGRDVVCPALLGHERRKGGQQY